MSNITAKMVQELREKTGAGMLDCKKALAESNGDMEAAVKILREKGLAAAANRTSKTAAEGLNRICVKDNTAIIVEVNCETDFVTRNESFIAFADSTAEFIAGTKPADLDALMNTDIKGIKFSEELASYAAKMGENIKVRRFTLLKAESGEVFGQYIHGGGKIGVVLKVKLSDASKSEEQSVKDLIKDLCMQIAAAEPKYIKASEVTQNDLDNERAIYTQQMKNEGKPEQVIAKIVEGKISKYYELVCLVDQLFIKDQAKKVKEVISEVSKQAGISIEPVCFVRYKVGEGIEKKQVDFAAEVQAQLSAASAK